MWVRLAWRRCNQREQREMCWCGIEITAACAGEGRGLLDGFLLPFCCDSQVWTWACDAIEILPASGRLLCPATEDRGPCLGVAPAPCRGSHRLSSSLPPALIDSGGRGPSYPRVDQPPVAYCTARTVVPSALPDLHTRAQNHLPFNSPEYRPLAQPHLCGTHLILSRVISSSNPSPISVAISVHKVGCHGW